MAPNIRRYSPSRSEGRQYCAKPAISSTVHDAHGSGSDFPKRDFRARKSFRFSAIGTPPQVHHASRTTVFPALFLKSG